MKRLVPVILVLFLTSCGFGGIFGKDDEKDVSKSDEETQQAESEDKNEEKKSNESKQEDQKVVKKPDDPNVRYNKKGEKLVRRRNPYYLTVENQPEYIWVRADRVGNKRISENLNESINAKLNDALKSNKEREDEMRDSILEEVRAGLGQTQNSKSAAASHGSSSSPGSNTTTTETSRQVRLLPSELQLEDGRRIFVNKIMIRNLIQSNTEDIVFLSELMTDFIQRKLDQYVNLRISSLGNTRYREDLNLDRLSVLHPDWGIIQTDDSANAYLLVMLDVADSSYSKYAKRKIYKIYFYVFDGFSAQKIYKKEKIFLIDLEKIVDLKTNEFNLQSVQNIINELVPELAMSLSNVGWYAKVISRVDERLFIDRGKDSGIRVGDTLEMYGPGIDIIDQTTRRYRGRSVGQRKGVIRVSLLLPGDISEVELISGEEVNPGDIGRVILKKKEVS